MTSRDEPTPIFEEVCGALLCNPEQLLAQFDAELAELRDGVTSAPPAIPAQSAPVTTEMTAAVPVPEAAS